jgi:hypothetical protein
MLAVFLRMPLPKRCVYMFKPPHNCLCVQLEEVFNRYGRLRKVWVARKPPGFAFIHFEDVRDAEDATRALDGALVVTGVLCLYTCMFAARYAAFARASNCRRAVDERAVMAAAVAVRAAIAVMAALAMDIVVSETHVYMRALWLRAASDRFDDRGGGRGGGDRGRDDRDRGDRGSRSRR